MFTLMLTEQCADEKEFCHFQHNFRELPAEKLARIQAILAEPPAPQRKRRSDAGTKRQNNQPELPVTSKTT